MTYGQKLKDPLWQKKRLEVMELASFQCKTCGSKTDTLTVHHINYRKGAEPWEYCKATELVCLCEPCHKAIEKEIIPKLREIAASVNPDILKEVAKALEYIPLVQNGIAGVAVDDESARVLASSILLHASKSIQTVLILAIMRRGFPDNPGGQYALYEEIRAIISED